MAALDTTSIQVQAPPERVFDLLAAFERHRSASSGRALPTAASWQRATAAPREPPRWSGRSR